MSFDINSLITDRTQADVGNGTKKGSYNATDLNRVGNAMNYVASRLVARGFIVSINPKTDWKEQDWPTPSTMERYLADLEELRGKLALMESTPSVPEDVERLTYVEANNIEKILVDIDFLLTNAAKAWCYSGDVFSGEV